MAEQAPPLARVLVVEDDPAQRSLIAGLLSGAGYAVQVAEDVDGALGHLDGGHVTHLVLSDYKLKAGDGMQLLAAVRERFPDTGFVLATAYGSIQHAVAAMRAGADDYLPKPFDLDELEARIRALARRGEPAAPSASPSFAGLGVDGDSGAVCLNGTPMELAPREAAMLRALLARPGQAVAKERLVETVFPGEDVQPDAIEVVAYRLRKRLAPTGVQLVTLRGLGYLLKAGA